MPKKKIVKKQITKNIKSLRKENVPKNKKNNSKKTEEKPTNYFVQVLAIVSIMGFLTILSKSWFEFELSIYVEALTLLFLGLGFIMESEPRVLFSKDVTINKRNFSRLTTFTIGAIAAIAGFLSFPFINVQHFVFLAIKGVIAFIAIVFIAVETWIIKNDGTIN